MLARTSSRRFSMISGVSPSRFNRNMTRRLDRTAWLWRKRPFLAYIDRGTGSNAGKVRPVHRDMFDGKFGGVFGSTDHFKDRGLRTTAPRVNSVWMTLNDEAMSEHLHQRVRLVVGKAQFQDLSLRRLRSTASNARRILSATCEATRGFLLSGLE